MSRPLIRSGQRSQTTTGISQPAAHLIVISAKRFRRHRRSIQIHDETSNEKFS